MYEIVQCNAATKKLSSAPYLSDKQRRELREMGMKICAYANYECAGTVEFLMDIDTSAFYFIEVNPRVQIEHTVTEEVTGIDIVKAQNKTRVRRNVPKRPLTSLKKAEAGEWESRVHDRAGMQQWINEVVAKRQDSVDLAWQVEKFYLAQVQIKEKGRSRIKAGKCCTIGTKLKFVTRIDPKIGSWFRNIHHCCW